MRDSLTTADEQEGIRSGRLQRGTLKRDAIEVDAVVSTIGFPLVGGPAGTMEGGRQADIARSILAAKNVPYFVAAPLLIQVCQHTTAHKASRVTSLGKSLLMQKCWGDFEFLRRHPNC